MVNPVTLKLCIITYCNIPKTLFLISETHEIQEKGSKGRFLLSKITLDIYGHISKKRATQTASQFDKYAPNKNLVNKSSTN